MTPLKKKLFVASLTVGALSFLAGPASAQDTYGGTDYGGTGTDGSSDTFSTGTTTTTTTTTSTGTSSLALTGVDSDTLLIGGSIVLATGAALTFTSKRRQAA